MKKILLTLLLVLLLASCGTVNNTGQNKHNHSSCKH
ncbi:lipoprotein [Lentisphaera marina]